MYLYKHRVVDLKSLRARQVSIKKGTNKKPINMIIYVEKFNSKFGLYIHNMDVYGNTTNSKMSYEFIQKPFL